MGVNLDEYYELRNGTRKRFEGANVKFFDEYIPDPIETEKQGRPIYKCIPSISIQWPGGDETVRAIEPQDKIEYPAHWAAYQSQQEPPTQGTPLTEWSMLPRTYQLELAAIGIKTVEQLAFISDEVKRRIGPLQKYCKIAKEWLESAGEGQTQIVALKEQLEREEKRSKKLEEQLELALQRIEALEGTKLTDDNPRGDNKRSR